MKILIADDDPISILYLQSALHDWGYEVIVATDGASAVDILMAPDSPTLAIIDWLMPGMDGIDVCRLVRERVKDCYIYMIMLTSKNDVAHVVEAMNAGADDFITKPFDVEEMHVRIRAGKRISDLEKELRIKATRDALTGVYNRGTIIEILEKEIARHERQKTGVALIFADIDHFKSTNDIYGHLAGDAVLIEVAKRMGSGLRSFDTRGRYGGEELIIVLPTCSGSEALKIAERVRAAVAETAIETEFGKIDTSISIGVSAVEDKNMSLNELINLADKALYQAKSNGRNRVERWI